MEGITQEYGIVGLLVVTILILVRDFLPKRQGEFSIREDQWRSHRERLHSVANRLVEYFGELRSIRRDLDEFIRDTAEFRRELRQGLRDIEREINNGNHRRGS